MSDSYKSINLSFNESSSNDISMKDKNRLNSDDESSVHFSKLLQTTGSGLRSLCLESQTAMHNEKKLHMSPKGNLVEPSKEKLPYVGNLEGKITKMRDGDGDKDSNPTNKEPLCFKGISNQSSDGGDSFVRKIPEMNEDVHSKNSNLFDLLQQGSYGNLKSPDLFYDSCDEEDKTSTGIAENGFQDNTLNRDYEKNVLKKIRNCLSGVLPPPSVTILQLDMFEEILSRKDSILSFLDEFVPSKSVDCKKANDINSETTSTLTNWKATHSLEDIKTLPWPEIFHATQHGLCYNVTKDSETIEYLNLAVIDRFIGSETTSSYRNLPSATVKSPVMRQRLVKKSPGNRLSHLAKRRAIFSSATLAEASQKSSTLIGRQILLDGRKNKGCRNIFTPRRLSPSSQGAHKNPKTSKRALFQSPLKDTTWQAFNSTESNIPRPDLSTRVENSKRTLLFSPVKSINIAQQQQQSTFSPLSRNNKLYDTSLKRKRELDEYGEVSNQKNRKISDNNLTPWTMKCRSQSFCIGTDSQSIDRHHVLSDLKSSENCLAISLMSNNNMLKHKMVNILQKSHSETSAAVYTLSENQRKKLLWAVSQALQEKKITTKHEKFKEYASVLAKVVKRLFLDYYQKRAVSNSETMLKLARQYAYYVTVNMSFEVIHEQAVQKLLKAEKASSKPSGYIGPNELDELQKKKMHLTENVSTKKSDKLNSVGSDKSTASLVYQEFTNDTGKVKKPADYNILEKGDDNKYKKDLGVSTNINASCNNRKPFVLTNSSSKSNANGAVLRENIDSDLRRSAQKTSALKDQFRSPYCGSDKPTSLVKTPGTVKSDSTAVMASRVKRHIVFDC